MDWLYDNVRVPRWVLGMAMLYCFMSAAALIRFAAH